MLVGQQIGPFLIEKELGAGAMGAVYRGKYVKTGQVVAVKVMAPGTGGSEGSQAAARFERESEVLKQLKHPNIVRLFGVGRYHGTPYYAMEYIQGESLDRVMARRGRIAWEEVVDLGQQLCDALQHAHEAGIVHRDLKPSNLMLLPDGTLKLTDFGIAKDLDRTALTAANNTVGTAAYMSPEQCKGEPLTSKSDLYSFGIVLYELVTGRKPFTAENAMDMFLLHVKGEFDRPSRIVLDIPVWLDNLICQLMEKKPEHRPLDAETVARALAGIQEKVEAQQSAGVDAVKVRRMDRPRGQRGASDEDRAAARGLLGKKDRRKKKGKGLMIALQAGALLVALAAVVAVLIYALQPPSADKLHKQAEKLWEAGKQDRAYDGPIKEYLRRYGKLDDDRTKQVRAWADDYEIRGLEDLMDKHIRHQAGKSRMAVGTKTEGEELAFKAAMAEHDGDRTEATKLWQQVLEKEPDERTGVTARRHLDQLARIDKVDTQFGVIREDIRLKRNESPRPDEFEQQAFLAWRQENLGDLAGARLTYDKLRDMPPKDANERFWTLFAAVRSRALKEPLDKKPQNDTARLELVTKVVDDVEKALEAKQSSLLNLRAILQDVIVVYDKEADMAAVVKKAKELREEIDTKHLPLKK